MKAAEKLIQVAMAEIGYLEKASNKDLDIKTANAGSSNYTKYARDLYPSLQGQPWCDMFVDECRRRCDEWVAKKERGNNK